MGYFSIEDDRQIWHYANGNEVNLKIDNNNVVDIEYTCYVNNIDDIVIEGVDKSFYEVTSFENNKAIVRIKDEFFKEMTIDEIKEFFFK